MRPGQDYSLLSLCLGLAAGGGGRDRGRTTRYSPCVSAWLLEVVGETGSGLLVTLFLYLGLAAGGGGRDWGSTSRYFSCVSAWPLEVVGETGVGQDYSLLSSCVSAWLLEVVGEAGAGLLIILLVSQLGCWRRWARPVWGRTLLFLWLACPLEVVSRDRIGARTVAFNFHPLAAGGVGIKSYGTGTIPFHFSALAWLLEVLV